MINVNKLRGRMAEKGRSGQDMAKVIGKTPKTFYAKMKAGVFDSDEMVEEEILRLQTSPHVKLARREEAIRNRRRQYMYQLRMYEKKGKALEAQGVTLEELEAMAGDIYD